MRQLAARVNKMMGVDVVVQVVMVVGVVVMMMVMDADVSRVVTVVMKVVTLL